MWFLTFLSHEAVGTDLRPASTSSRSSSRLSSLLLVAASRLPDFFFRLFFFFRSPGSGSVLETRIGTGLSDQWF